MKRAYLETVALVERLHRHFLEVVKNEIDRLGVRDINNVQALILYNVGADEMTVGELTQRGYYLGSNVSYNLKKLIECGYIAQARSQHDRRSVRIKLTETGLELHKKLDQIFETHAREVEGGIDASDLAGVSDVLRKLERFWDDQRIGTSTSMSSAAD
jgi:DNA-binding MarR family transcriptional regulator